MIITIDGPAGTGKTTIARELAHRVQFHYFDTGAMYRALTYCLIKNQIEISNENGEALHKILKDFQFDIKDLGREKRYYVSHEDVTDVIRSREVTQKVSEISALGAVREAMVAIQREFGKGKHAIFEGRDMGTVVFPDADMKIFLTARPAVRARRRYLELEAKKMPINQEEVLQEMIERDHFDSTREISPLKQAPDAFVIDTSDLTIEQILESILSRLSILKQVKKWKFRPRQSPRD